MVLLGLGLLVSGLYLWRRAGEWADPSEDEKARGNAGETGMTLEVGTQTGYPRRIGQRSTRGLPASRIGLLPGDGDEYILLEGGPKGQRGFFTRDDSGRSRSGRPCRSRIATRASAEHS
jgi:hypothetical protein